jgi:hypothetical protein
MTGTTLAFLLALAVFVAMHIARAESLTIARLLADPAPYHMKVVTLEGTSHQIQALRDAPSSLPRLDFQCYLVHPPYTFVLADDTGFLQITVRGRPPCVSKHSPAEPPDVSEGNKVVVEAQITVTPGYREGVGARTVEALAVGIRRLDE